MKDEVQNIDLDNPEFQSVWKLVKFTNQSVFMTGKAGTGKSTFLKYICANTSKRHVVLAPTGIAAVNVGGVTMHSFFKLPFKPLLPDDPEFAIKHLRKRMKYTANHVKLLRELELIIIDEISMVRADLIDFVDKILRVYSGNMRQPFGGKQMLFVGDIFQLEPVVSTDMREVLRHYYKNSYFFSATVFRDMQIVPIELRKVYRQQDLQFVEMLDRFRIGSPTDRDIYNLNSRVKIDEPANSEEFVMTLATRRDIVDSINDRRLEELPSVAVTYEGKIVDDFPENSLPTSKTLVLKTGAQVVMIRNDFQKRWVNGTVAKVYSATPDHLEIELENGERYVLDPEIWENVVYKYDEESKKVNEIVVGTFTQFPLRLAWALTIHKSQGLTFNNVVIDVGQGAFAGGQTYVALSRCRSFEGIELRRSVSQRDAFVNPNVVQFSRSFNDSVIVNKALERAAADDAYESASKAFEERNFAVAVDKFAEATLLRQELNNEAVRRLLRNKLSELGAAEKRVAELEEELAENRRVFDRLSKEYVAMGRECLDEIGDITSALANLNKALSISAGNVDARFEKARALAVSGDTDSAIELFSGLLRELPDADSDEDRGAEAKVFELKLLLELSAVYRSVVDLHNSLDLLMRAEKRFPNEAPVHDNLATLYEEIGDEESAAYHIAKSKAIRRRKK